MAWQIVRHAFAMVFGNFGQALRVSVGPLLIGLVATLLFLFAKGLAASEISLALITIFGLLLLAPILMFVSGWVAVSWHRFILLEEFSGLIPTINDRPVWPYIGRSFVLILTMIVPLLIVGSALNLLGANGMQDTRESTLVLRSIASILLSYFWLRIAIILPGVALNKTLSGSESWALAAPFSGMIFMVGVYLTAINIVPFILLDSIFGVTSIVGFIGTIIIQWTTFMLGLSILTTLYGHIIEGRALSE